MSRLHLPRPRPRGGGRCAGPGYLPAVDAGLWPWPGRCRNDSGRRRTGRSQAVTALWAANPPPRSFTTRNPAATPAWEGRTQDQPAGPPRPLTRAWGLVTTSTGGPTGHVGCRGHRSAGQPRVQRDRQCLAEVGGTRTLGADGSPVTGTWA